MEGFKDPEELIICPYDKSHQIRRFKMAGHLVKCKKNFPNKKMGVCDFNSTHKYPEPEIKFHMDHCPDRLIFEQKVYQEEGVDLNRYPVQNIEVACDENWDNDNVPTYNPQEYCMNNEILRHLDVESAAKRKNFRHEERKRINNLTAAPMTEKRVKESRDLPKPKTTPLPSRSSSSTSSQQLPNPVSKLMERIKIGANKAYIPK